MCAPLILVTTSVSVELSHLKPRSAHSSAHTQLTRATVQQRIQRRCSNCAMAKQLAFSGTTFSLFPFLFFFWSLFFQPPHITTAYYITTEVLMESFLQALFAQRKCTQKTKSLSLLHANKYLTVCILLPLFSHGRPHQILPKPSLLQHTAFPPSGNPTSAPSSSGQPTMSQTPK